MATWGPSGNAYTNHPNYQMVKIQCLTRRKSCIPQLPGNISINQNSTIVHSNSHVETQITHSTDLIEFVKFKPAGASSPEHLERSSTN